MQNGRISLALATAMLAAASASTVDGLDRGMPAPRRGRKQPRKLEGEYLGQQSQEIKDWNAAVEAKKAAKRKRKQLRDDQS